MKAFLTALVVLACFCYTMLDLTGNVPTARTLTHLETIMTATDYAVVRHTYGTGYVVKLAGQIVATFDDFEQAATRAYNLNRARLLN